LSSYRLKEAADQNIPCAKFYRDKKNKKVEFCLKENCNEEITILSFTAGSQQLAA
jgi:hypothetical protein